MPESSMQHQDAAARATPERRAVDSIVAALLLACVGGYLDAFLYIVHGQVFAGAMTGNAVLFGISLLSGSRRDILHHAVPLLAFAGGVWLAEVLQTRVKHHAVSIGLAAEAAGLLAASFLPSNFPDHLYVFWICFFTAFQITSFRKAGPYSYNSTFVTGDLRSTVIGFYEALKPEKRSEALRLGRDMGVLFLLFLAGATAGGWFGHRMANHALWLPVTVLGIVLGMALRAAFSPWPPDERTGL